MSVLAAAFVPGPPVLVPELAGQAAPELERVRAAADAAVREIADLGGTHTPVVVLGAGAATRAHPGRAAGTFRPWGVDVRVGGEPADQPSDRPLPLPLTVGAWLLDRAGVPLERRTYQEIAPDGPVPAAPDQDVVLLVVGDASSTRTPKAPGAYHPQAEAYDADVRLALASGDPAALAALDDARAGEVGAAGAGAWRVTAAWWGQAHAGGARVDADEAPYGVGYLVGVWTS